MTDGSRHAPNLAVLTFHQFERNPAVWNIFAETNGRRPGLNCGLRAESNNPAGTGMMSLKHHSGRQTLERVIRGHAFDLGPVGAEVALLGIKQAGIESGFVTEEE